MSEAAPLVSVLIPARDAAPTIGMALRTVQAQTISDWEVVVVDDGSTDSTAAIVEGLAVADRRIRLLRLPPTGIVGALNAGLALCRAPLIARFDADDLMHRDRFALQLSFLNAQPGLAGAGTLIRCFPRRSLRDGMLRYERWLNSVVEVETITHERFVESPLVHPSMMIRSTVLRAVGGWRDSRWAEDWDLWLRLFEGGHKLGKVPRRLHFWRDIPTRLTRTDARYAEGALVEARAHFLARGPLKDRSAVLWGAGPVGKALLRALDREGARVEALIDVDPRKIHQIIHGRRVLPAAEVSRVRPAILLAAVGAEGARDEIRRAAHAAGFIEGADFFACA